jgi:D-alanyl-D-alanine carboxypeptidase (penicillin-binding protein 5/6)
MWWGWWCAVVSVVLAISAPPAAASPAVASRVPASLLIDALTGESLSEEDADTPKPVGLLSQLMIVLLSLEEVRLGALPLDVPVTVSKLAAPQAGAGGSRVAAGGAGISLYADRVYLLSDLLKAVLVSSANDAATAVAEAIAGSVPACVDLMNARAQRLGMQATHYSTIGEAEPSTSDTTTAHDLARLAQALVSHPQVLQWASLTGLPFDQGSFLLSNNNQLLGTVAGVDGLQVASDRVAGYSIVATAQRGALRLIAVVLGAPDSSTRQSCSIGASRTMSGWKSFVPVKRSPCPSPC